MEGANDKIFSSLCDLAATVDFMNHQNGYFSKHEKTFTSNDTAKYASIHETYV